MTDSFLGFIPYVCYYYVQEVLDYDENAYKA